MRNLYKPNRFKVAGVQAQQTLGGDVMQADEEGDYVEFRDYKRALDEIDMLKHTIKYWETEAQTDHARWLRTLEDGDKLRAEVELWKLRSDNWQKFCQSTRPDLFNENARLKSEVERLRKAGDWMCGLFRFDFVTKEWNAAKEGKPQS